MHPRFIFNCDVRNLLLLKTTRPIIALVFSIYNDSTLEVTRGVYDFQYIPL